MTVARDPNERELDSLMDRLSQGDRNAFDPLFAALWPRALRLARTRLPAACAHDAAQSALMKVFANASAFEPGRAALPWFYAIVGNEVRATARAGRVRDARAAEPDAEHALVASDDPEALLVSRELEHALERAIADLDDTSADAIRAMLGRVPHPGSTAAFRKRVSRAYATLRLALTEAHAR